MPVSRFWLWTLLLLLTVGCQSTPSGTRALFSLARTETKETATEDDDSQDNDSLKVVSKSDIVNGEDKSSWRDDPVLMEVVERELADASPERRSQWIERLDSIDPNEIPFLLSERRRLIRAGESDEVTTVDAATASEPPQSDEPSVVLEETRDRKPHGLHPLRALGEPLQAPTPPSLEGESDDTAEVHQTAMVDGTETSNPASKESGGFMDNVLDVFGVGGERQAGESLQTKSDIRPAGLEDEHLQSPARENGSPASQREEAARAMQSVYWQEELDKLVSLLETQLAHQEPGETQREQDLYIRQHVALKLLYLIGSRRPEALQAIPLDDEAQQEFWTEMMWALSNVFDDEALPNPSERARETVERLRSALEHLAPEAGLRVHHAVFCRQIDGYGSYALFDKDEFTPGQSVLVYAEAENFGVQVTTQGDHVTRLQSTLDIHEESVDGPVVFHNELPPTEDICRSRRRDYFHSYRIKLPSDLKPGPHVLTLSVRDEVSHKIGTTTLNFMVR
ncbi:MAG: hypothetical protein KDA93_18715 [Planctomycetaceae bacterium]|nr:hypothetical protein [Planctomycetaceae bacterium]